MAVEPTANVLESATRSRTGMIRVGIAMMLGTVAFIMPFSAGSSILLPARIALTNPDEKVQLLALITGISAVVALLANVIFGTLSDHTRTRFGARSPWILGGAVATALLLIPVSLAEGFGWLTFWWCLATAAINATAASVAAILPDRVPHHRRATIAALIGIGLLLGHAVGAVVGSIFAERTTLGFQVVGGLFVVLAVATVIIAPDFSNLDSSRVRIRIAEVTASFRFPRHAPDFYWVLWGRLVLVLGYFMVNGFQLYIFTDYVGMTEADAAAAVRLNSMIFLGTALIGAAIAGPFSDRLRRRKLPVILASVLAVIAAAAPMLSSDHQGMIWFAIIGGVAFGSYYAVDAALTSEVLPSDESRGRDLGILNIANTGGQALAPAASAALVAVGFGFFPVFIGAMAFCALGALCIAPIKSVR
ncbi:MFS transporter [Microbacterium sp.]|uniref:MFS transporter n=1 Tax=Microbacterium sp. TaxID=51671 RepID=UPI0028A25B6B|nr:MFS transporter [Microbacterium sp.]